MSRQTPTPSLLLTIFGLVVACAPAAAAQIYKWVSGDGTTHYGESLPDGEVASFEVLDVTPATPRPRPETNDYRSTLDMAASLQADRLARERVRLEKEKLRQEERRARDEAQRYKDTYASPSYLVPYYRYPYRSYPRPPRHGKHPGHPPSRPSPRPRQVPMRVYVDP